MQARPKTPDVEGLGHEASRELLERTRLGKIISPLIKAISRLQQGEEPEEISVEALANRVNVLTASSEERIAGLTSSLEQVLGQGIPPTQPVSEDRIAREVRAQLASLTTPDTTSQRLLVEPPLDFARVPEPRSRDRMEDLKLNFSCLNVAKKFSGSKDFAKKGEMDVISLLESLTRGQSVMRLTEKEFLNVFIQSCISTPQEQLIDLIKLNEEGEMSIASIYLRFTDSFFFDLRPEQASAKLNALTQHKHPFTSLSDAEAVIKKWSKLASLGTKSSLKRDLMSTWHFRETYLRIIPDKFTSVILQQLESLESLQGRDATSQELVSITRGYRFEIDNNFYKKNAQNSHPQQPSKGQGFSSKGKKGKQNKAAANSQGPNGNVNQASGGSHNSGAKPKKGGGNSNQHGGTQNQYNGTQSRPNNNNSGGKNGGKKSWQKTNQGSNSLHMKDCKLCGQVTHTFDNCPLFKPADRIVSSQKCPCALNSYHLQKACPLKN